VIGPCRDPSAGRTRRGARQLGAPQEDPDVKSRNILTIEAYVRHAERFGTYMLYEVAAGLVWPFKPDLTTLELARLSLRLQELDPKWRLPKRPTADRRSDRDDGFITCRFDRVLFALEI